MFPVIGTPKCVAFRSKLTGKYLQSVHEGSEERAGGSMFFLAEVRGADADEEDEDVLASPYIRFYLEPSKEHDGLLHVRCCYNNTYWVAKHGGNGSGSGHWTIGIVNEPDADISRPSCTLFQPVPLTDVDNNISVRFLRPSQTPRSEFASRVQETGEEAYLHLGTRGHADQQNSLYDFSILELSRLVLPRHVAFKGDNDRYLCAIGKGRDARYLVYTSSDIGDPNVVNTIFPEYVGDIIRIRSNILGKFWQRSWWNYIAGDSPHSTGSSNQDMRFQVVPVDDYFALKNLGNNNFCVRDNGIGMGIHKLPGLNAGVSTITAKARIRIEEAVLERRIDNVRFKLSESRIYGETPLFIPNVSADNRTSQPNNKTLTMEYKVTDTRSFTSTVGLKIGVDVSFRAGIPIIADGQVAMSTEVSTEHAWGKATEVTKTLEAKYEAIVPSMSKVILRAAVTQGFVDVPFSYRQRDVLTTGEVVEVTLHDGMFTGVNSYNFHYETTEERL